MDTTLLLYDARGIRCSHLKNNVFSTQIAERTEELERLTTELQGAEDQVRMFKNEMKVREIAPGGTH